MDSVLSVRITTDQAEGLAAVAREQGRSKGEVVRRLVDVYLAVRADAPPMQEET